jgi:hypothetical protein
VTVTPAQWEKWIERAGDAVALLVWVLILAAAAYQIAYQQQ